MGALRSFLRPLHRDLGFLAAGLTLVYALSGILLNHIHAWNPTYEMVRVGSRIAPYEDPSSFAEKDVPHLLERMGEGRRHTGVFFPSPGTVQIFMEEGRVLTVDLVSGAVEGEIARRRPLLWRLNALHLNRAGGGWTWFADLYAALLGFLALSGLFMVRGRRGLTGRGGWLFLLGVLLAALAAGLLPLP